MGLLVSFHAHPCSTALNNYNAFQKMWRFCPWALSVMLVIKISNRMSIIVDIRVFVSMISNKLGQVEHETRNFWPHRLGIRRRFAGSFILCFSFSLSLDRVVEYADWSHTCFSCNVGRNGSD